MGLRSGSLGAGGRCHGKCDRSGDAGLLNLTPESSFVAQFLAGKIGDDVALRLVGEERQRRDSGPTRSPATPRQGFALPLLTRRVKVLSKYRIQEGSSKPAG